MEKTSFLSIPAAILLGSIIIAVSILISGGVIKPKNTNTGSKTTTTAQDIDSKPSVPIKERLLALANDLKLDKNKFQSCLDNPSVKEEINKDISDAESAGINGTPGFVIGKTTADGTVAGIKVAGAYPYDTFKQIFDQLNANSTIESIIAAQDDLEKANASIDNDPILGNKNAPVTLVEFSDYECPFCKRHFTQTLSNIKKDYIDTGKVRLVYRDFIAVPSHNPAAEEEAIAANCAREQGGDEVYFKFHDEVFKRTKANGEGI